jgi:hypothetical protein
MEKRKMVLHPLLKLKEILGDRKKGIPPIIPLSRSAWYAGIKNGYLPQPVKIGARSVAWRASDIAAIAQKSGNGHE